MRGIMTEGLIIDGQRVNASDGGTFDVYDPSSGTVLATVAKATRADVKRGVQSARAALESKTWGGLAPAERERAEDCALSRAACRGDCQQAFPLRRFAECLG